ncbi:VOC family protein [Listeria grandensis]|uniref:VOC family protein n=1 Tax=Listeria grandensis TaxID=1494963 RepID=UPI0016251073|nr:VOC family protein [Listeria grandensis]MBC1475197.1 VOC family protein [Listeria grandensis]
MIQINPHTEIGKVVLKTKNNQKLAAFYKEIIGLKVIAESVDSISLGTGKRILVELVQVKRAQIPKEAKTGLYHTAFLLPSREALGSFLQHLLESEYPLDGAGDHIFSEALYFRDPEGNGIEVYADRPRAEWQRDEAGNLPMATNQVDGDGLLMAGADMDWSGVPKDTKVGHIHLQIGDIEATRNFYQTMLGFTIMTEIPSALFFAAGDYHHHIGANIWAGRDLPKLADDETGLAYFTIKTADIEKLQAYLIQQGITFQEKDDDILVEDPNGIKLRITEHSWQQKS